MFGLTFEKLFLVAIIAGVLIGPQRLPAYAHQLRETVRGLRAFLDASRARAEAEMGVALTRAEWEALDLRQYDPRRLVRDALDTTQTRPLTEVGQAEHHDDTNHGHGVLTDRDAHTERTTLPADCAPVRPGQRYLVTGSAAHPRRIAISSLPPDDPRRIAATPQPPERGDQGAPADSGAFATRTPLGFVQPTHRSAHMTLMPATTTPTTPTTTRTNISEEKTSEHADGRESRQ